MRDGNGKEPILSVRNLKKTYMQGKIPLHALDGVSFDVKKGEFISSTPVSGNIRHMYYHRPAQEIWFGTDAGNIGRAKLP